MSATLRALRVAFTDLEDIQTTTIIFIKNELVTYEDLPASLRHYVIVKPLGLEYRSEWDDLHWHPWEEVVVPAYVKELRIRAVQIAFAVQRMVTSAFLNLCAGQPMPEPSHEPEARLTYSLHKSMISLASWHMHRSSTNRAVDSHAAMGSNIVQGSESYPP